MVLFFLLMECLLSLFTISKEAFQPLKRVFMNSFAGANSICKEEVFAEVCFLLIRHKLCHGLGTLVRGAEIIKSAVTAYLKVFSTVGTGLISRGFITY